MASSSTPPPGAPDPNLADRLLAGRYRLLRPIASGGMAEVWEATDQILTRRVAVKLLHGHLARDEAFVRRFRGEAIAAAKLAHPSIVSVYDTVSDDGVEGIVMELVTGTTLRADIDLHGPLKIAAARAIGVQVADALAAAHAAGLVHRDIKPANILLAKDGRVLVADFGIAKAAEGSDLTLDGAMVGTAKYLAPEQVEGRPVDGRTDLYALGIVLYEALTGIPPFVAENDTATALARLQRDPLPVRSIRPEVPPALADVVTVALARQPDHRYPDARAMRRVLQTLDLGPATRVAPAAPAPATAPEDPTAGWAAAPDPDPMPETSGPAPDTDHHPVAPRRASWGRRLLVAGLVLALLGATAYGLSLVLARSPKDLPITSVASFDPNGDNGTENDAQLPATHDGDTTTVWTSERYRTTDLKALKGGVGLIVQIADDAELHEVTLTTPTRGWNASFYLTSGTPPGDLSGWGESVAGVTNGGDTTTVELFARHGRNVLIWFTKTPPDGRITVGEIGIRGV